MNFDKIELDSSSINRLRLDFSLKSQMNIFQSSFITGIIKKNIPKKIVEIGVAEGGTTALIYDSLEKYSNDFEMYSIDILEKWNTSIKIGDEFRRIFTDKKNHKFLLGNPGAAHVDEIGTGIDLLILDTAHVLPGEILDFLAFLPNMEDSAWVILHDIAWNHYSFGDGHEKYVFKNRKNTFATKLLFDVVDANKYLNFEEQSDLKYPNIGAFQLTEDTRLKIHSVFSSLTLNWEYLPPTNEWELYRNIIEKKYDGICLSLFDYSYTFNYKTHKYHYPKISISSQSHPILYKILKFMKYLKTLKKIKL